MFIENQKVPNLASIFELPLKSSGFEIEKHIGNVKHALGAHMVVKA